MKKINKTAFVIGTSIIAGFSSTSIMAESNPFESTKLAAGYMNLAEADAAQGETVKAKDGSCGEGKCGNKKDKTEDKAKEGKCGEGKCGDKKMDESKMKEGKCGEGKCGDKK